jgi:ABC-type dipeptide/oligopeptide/nickel transport system permease component
VPQNPLSLNETLSLMSGEFGHFQTLWGAYFAVTFGILAAVTSLKFPDRMTRVSVKIAIGVGYAWFAYLNLMALYKVRDDREHLAEYALKVLDQPRPADAADPTPLKVLAAKPPERWELVLVHVIADLAVLGLLTFAPNSPSRPGGAETD